MLRSLVHSHRTRRLAWPGAVAVVAVMAVLPLRWLGWVGYFQDLTLTLVGPLSGQFEKLLRWRSPALTSEEQRELAESREQRDHYQMLYYRAAQDIEELREHIEELQRGIALNPELPVTVYAVPVIARSSDLSSGLFTVRAPASLGAVRGTVATAGGVQLVGRVTALTDRTATVQPITDRAAGPINGVIIFDEDRDRRVACRLEPIGDGLLKGPVEDRKDAATQEAIVPRVGQTVRLSDPELWPRSAQMLVIGRIEAVESAPDQPLRKIITVRPTTRLDRVFQVLLRLVGNAEGEPPRDAGRPGTKGGPR
jgi:cell shape-determining protein MreC